MNFSEATGFEALLHSLEQCRKGKLWKASVAHFYLNGAYECMRLEQEIRSGTYKPRKPHTFTLTYPKVRPCSSTHIRDRVVQRSLNDNVIYPAMTRSFIYDNMACQNGKGTTCAMDRLNRMLRRWFIHHGGNVGYVLQFDVEGYYRTMRHDIALECFSKHLDAETVEHAMEWLQRQYPYDVGFEPGSQMVQILGISMLDRFDHIVKEQLRVRNYLRYMDDGILLSEDPDQLAAWRDVLAEELARIGMHFHAEKTRIYPIRDGIRILGFTFLLTDTGKVVRLIDPKNVKHERKKLYRMAQLVRRGEMSVRKFWECYTSWKAHAALGNTWRVQMRMDQYVKSLMEGIYERNRNKDPRKDRSGE